VLFPLWVLALGPVLYGLPHLIASFRFIPYILSRKHFRVRAAKETKNIQNFYLFTIGIAGWIACARFLADRLSGMSFEIMNSNYLEIFALMVSAVALPVFMKGWVRLRLAQVIFACVIAILAYLYPEWTLGAFVLGHHWVGFGYWILAAQTPRERSVSYFALILFTLASGFIWIGGFDFAYKWYSPSAELPWANLDYVQIAKSVFPKTQDYKTWFHLVVMYAFGQSVHYFVWLKVIPDQCHYHPIPTSFRQSYQLLIQEFGKKWTRVILSGASWMAAVWFFFSYSEARIFYFALASYHGYLEIAGLLVTRVKDGA
jgi:hypothetical protein